MTWSEDELHRWLAKRPRPKVLVGSVGHDAAVLRTNSNRAVQCTDQCIEGVHFAPDASAAQVGRKAANRALSDLAATAATPVSLLLAIAAPERIESSWLKRAIAAVARAAEKAGAELVGGDLAKSAGPLSLAVFAHGHLPGRRKAVGRDRARAGQRLVLTGAVGGSLAGRHLRFEPRLELGRALWLAGATAMMDVSDGLAWDLHRLARASEVAIDLQSVPIHRDARRAARSSGRSPLDHALHDGEDHELVACIAGQRLPAGCLPIGRVRAGSGLHLTKELTGQSRDELWHPGRGGWSHE